MQILAPFFFGRAIAYVIEVLLVAPLYLSFSRYEPGNVGSSVPLA